MDQNGRASEFREYLLESRELPPPPVSGGGFLRAMPAWAPGLVRRAGTFAVKPRANRQWADLAGSPSLRLHVGCGWTHLDGWVNVDLFATRADIAWDLRQGVPLPDGSVQAIFHEHMLEHLSMRDGFLFTKECARLLAPGGVLRIGVPDAGACIDSYSGKGSPDWAASRPTGMVAVQTLFYENGHCAMYDGETLTLLCQAAGLDDARRQEWGTSLIDPCPDTLDRQSGTLYVDARKSDGL